jgi:hypothetical protein
VVIQECFPLFRRFRVPRSFSHPPKNCSLRYINAEPKARTPGLQVYSHTTSRSWGFSRSSSARRLRRNLRQPAPYDERVTGYELVHACLEECIALESPFWNRRRWIPEYSRLPVRRTGSMSGLALLAQISGRSRQSSSSHTFSAWSACLWRCDL